jgi:hypothetical protein
MLSFSSLLLSTRFLFRVSYQHFICILHLDACYMSTPWFITLIIFAELNILWSAQHCTGVMVSCFLTAQRYTCRFTEPWCRCHADFLLYLKELRVSWRHCYGHVSLYFRGWVTIGLLAVLLLIADSVTRWHQCTGRISDRTFQKLPPKHSVRVVTRSLPNPWR